MTEQRDFTRDREICNAATEGPWNTVRNQAYAFDAAKDYLEVWSVTDPKGRLICIDTQDFCGIEDDETAGPNLQFIAAAREGWPASLDEIERLKAERESVRTMYDELKRAVWDVPGEPRNTEQELERISHQSTKEMATDQSLYLAKHTAGEDPVRLYQQIHALEAENHLLREELGR